MPPPRTFLKQGLSCHPPLPPPHTHSLSGMSTHSDVLLHPALNTQAIAGVTLQVVGHGTLEGWEVSTTSWEQEPPRNCLLLIPVPKNGMAGRLDSA